MAMMLKAAWPRGPSVRPMCSQGGSPGTSTLSCPSVNHLEMCTEAWGGRGVRLSQHCPEDVLQGSSPALTIPLHNTLAIPVDSPGEDWVKQYLSNFQDAHECTVAPPIASLIQCHTYPPAMRLVCLLAWATQHVPYFQAYFEEHLAQQCGHSSLLTSRPHHWSSCSSPRLAKTHSMLQTQVHTYMNHLEQLVPELATTTQLLCMFELVSSRTFQCVDGASHAAVFAPVADLANHSFAPTATHHLDLKGSEQQMCLRMRGRVGPGGPVHISYGPGLDNVHLLLRFGFLVPGNPNDRLEWPIGTMQPTSSALPHISLLADAADRIAGDAGGDEAGKQRAYTALASLASLGTQGTVLRPSKASLQPMVSEQLLRAEEVYREAGQQSTKTVDPALAMIAQYHQEQAELFNAARRMLELL